ncbi:MAG: SDR family NAD(P)-dependent oxidoreductase [Bacteroidota bacterium]|nr:SDR family NAD(P)-dependent oxidoreductase [Bacteroidota bacterium]
MTASKIIIVGATSGIGRKMAELYIRRDYKVGITGRRLELLEEIKQQFPQQVEFARFDITQPGSIAHLEMLVSKLDGLDILVISAGTGEPSKELSREIDKTTIDTNVNGFAEIANWAFNFFVKQGFGQLVTISSIAANRGNSQAPAYSASKAFQSIYFEGLAIKAAKLKKDIIVTCIEPGFVGSKMAKSDNLFWVVPVDKAARLITRAIDKKKRKAYISKRWWIIAKLLRWIPYQVLKKFG